MKIFEGMQDFFASVVNYLKTSSNLFFVFLGVFLVLSVVIIVITSFAYECMLTKTIDKINKFLERNPRINDDNLVAFNNLMKASRVPKTLRRQWQQFMLYREHPASYYMSFQHCVENPMRNSTYRQQMTVYKIISYILVVLSLVLSAFMTTVSQNFSHLFQEILIIPLTILVLYWVISMVLDAIHSAISSDLFQNYQYFEINMDKAMLTLPEFVDYEVLFSQDEIRRGIPVLFAYLQKRAIQEQQELEKARLKSVDHEKFDFDKAGLDGSLVLDRAMRETENFAAQRKKYLQEIERVNNEILALENNYKEQIKEYQRQVQTSKETVENLKEQLEQASSTIEINYIKKQMRDEINRQQVAEKDFDTLTDKHNQEVKSLNQEIKHYDDETKKAKQALEVAMLSEFNTYSIKVYDNLEKIVDDKMQGKVDDYKDQIRGLEGQLEEKNEELENVYTRYQEILSQMPEDQSQEQYDNYVEEQPVTKKSKKKKKGSKDEPSDDGWVQPEQLDEYPAEQYDYSQYDENQMQYSEYDEQNGVDQYAYDNQDYGNDQQVGYDYNNQYDEYSGQSYNDIDNGQYPTEYSNEYGPENEDMSNEQYMPLNDEDANNNYVPLDNNQYTENDAQYIPLDDNTQANYEDNQYVSMQEDYQSQEQYVPLDNNTNTNTTEYQPLENESTYVPLAEEKQINNLTDSKDNEDDALDFDDSDFDINFDKPETKTDKFEDMAFDFDLEDAKSDKKLKEEIKEPEEDVEEIDDDDFDINEALGLYTNLPAPKTTSNAEDKITSSTDDDDEDGLVDEQEEVDDLFEEDDDELPAPTEVKRKAGRPRKIVDESEIKPKRSVGRPRKNIEEDDERPKRSVGRPKKIVEDDDLLDKPTRGVGRPRKVAVEVTEKRRGRPRKDSSITEYSNVKRSVGRPKKEASIYTGVKRPGRPRKEGLDGATSPIKRSVGHPRKETDTTSLNQPKGKRGRPRKS